MPTFNQKVIAKRILEKVGNGGRVSVSKVIRESKLYSDKIAKNPQKVTKSKGFIKLMEEAGLTDRFLAQKQNQLIKATRLEKDKFDAEPIYEERKKGRKIWQEVIGYKHLSDEKIKILIEGTIEDPTGHKVAYIKKFPRHKEVFFRIPDSVVQTKILEMGLKVKDHFAPDKLNITEYELSDEEKNALKNLFP